MIYQRKDKFYFKDAEGILRKFNTKAEAEKAAGLVEEKDYAEEESDNKKENNNEAPDYGWQLENEEVDSEE